MADYPAGVSQPEALFGAIEGGGTSFRCAVGTAPQALVDETSIPTTDAAATLGGVVSFFQQAMRRHGPLVAVGLGCFGPLQLRGDAADFGRLLATPKAGWSGVDLLSPLHNALGVPVALDTDVGAAALAEWRLGAGRGAGSLVYITVGTGIGGALVPRQQDAFMMHAEMGHLPLRRDPLDATFPGSCPFHADCAEGLASGTAIRARWGCDLESLPRDHPGRLVIAGYLGQLAAAVALMLSPRLMVFGGGVMTDPAMLPLVRTATLRYLNGYLPELHEAAAMDDWIRRPELGGSSAIAGALLLAQAQAACSPPR